MKTEQELQEHVLDIINRRHVINFKTYYLSDYGEMALNIIVSEILKKFNRIDMLEVAYTTAKELILNATKANLKRVLFAILNLDMANDADYEKGMVTFRENLTEDKIRKYKEKFIEMDYPVITTFYFQENVLNIKVKNNFTLLPVEETKIRQKFETAHSFANLLDFYMEYGDNTEGAGLGLAMVGILLDNTGIDRHAFTLFSNKYNETAAKLELPLSDSYIPKRQVFEEERKNKNIPAEEYRKVFSTKVFKESPGDCDVETE